jgi:hypothetical protein
LPSNWASKSKQAARKAQLRLTPKGFGIEGKSEFNERGTSDEDDNKIQIHAPQASTLVVGSLRRRHCNFHRRMRGRPYVTAYDGGYYYPTSYYAPDYDYYGYPYSYYEHGPRYNRTVVRSGVRYYDSYGPRYYGSYWY